MACPYALVVSAVPAAEEAKVSQVTAIQCYLYLRDVCSWRLINRDAPLLLGGSGHVVQIDESLFRHKVKVWSNTGLKTYSPFVTGTIRLIEDILQEQIFGFLEWWMYPIARHSVICKWYHVEMLPRCSLSYSSTCILELSFIVTNGQPTTKCNNYLMYSNTALSTTP